MSAPSSADRHVYYDGQEMYGDAEATELIGRIMRNRPSAGGETRG
jgi:hypothetical protein